MVIQSSLMSLWREVIQMKAAQGLQRGGDSGEVVGTELSGNLLCPNPRSLSDL
jgi:hypothetical protein